MIKEIKFTDKALKQINSLLSKKDKGSFFRIAIKGGGCSGFQYAFTFDDEQAGDDRVIERDGVAVLIDETSWEYVVGSELHFAEELVGSFFTMRNPNAASTCGCGVSFSVG